MTFDERVVSTIVDILWKYNCTFDAEKIDYKNRYFDDIVCPEEVQHIVAMELEEALQKLYNDEKLIEIKGDA